MILDDWDSVVDAYQLDQEKGLVADNVCNQSLNDNACLRIIKTKYLDKEKEPVMSVEQDLLKETTI